MRGGGLLGVPVGGGFLCLLLVTPRVFRAPEGPAAREARRPHFVRRCASKPALALRSLRRPPHQWGRIAVNSPAGPAVADQHRGLALPLPTGAAAWPCRRRPAPRPGPATAHGHRSPCPLVPPAASTPAVMGVWQH